MQMNVRILGLPSDAEPSPATHAITFDHLEGDTLVYRYVGEIPNPADETPSATDKAEEDTAP